MEGIMEKRSTVGAVVAESLVFESNFGGAEGPASRYEQASRQAASVNSRLERRSACLRDHQDQRPGGVAASALDPPGQPPPEKCAAKACAKPPNPPRDTLPEAESDDAA